MIHRLKLAWNAFRMRPTMVNITIRSGAVELTGQHHAMISHCQFYRD